MIEILPSLLMQFNGEEKVPFVIVFKAGLERTVEEVILLETTVPRVT